MEKDIIKFCCFMPLLFAGFSASMNHQRADVHIVVNQEDFQNYMARVGEITLETINRQVIYSNAATVSPYWEVQYVLTDPVFLKKPGVPLVKALESLLDEKSLTQFECGVAQTVVLWRILLHPAFRVDEVIHRLEQADPEFRLPLLLSGKFAYWQNFMQQFEFSKLSMSKQKFVFNGTVELLPEQELEKFSLLYSAFLKVSPLFASSACERSKSEVYNNLPYFESSPRGAFSYLAHFPRVKTNWRGENLMSIGNGLFYGFGRTFSEGPKSLMEIGENLFRAVPPHDYCPPEKFNELQKIASILSIHPLQILPQSTPGWILDFNRIQLNVSEMLDSN